MSGPNEEEGQDYIVTFLYPVSIRVRSAFADDEMAVSMARDAFVDENIRETIVSAIDATSFWFDYDKDEPFVRAEPQSDF